MRTIVILSLTLFFGVFSLLAKNKSDSRKTVQMSEPDVTATMAQNISGHYGNNGPEFTPGIIVVKLKDDRMPLSHSYNESQKQWITQYPALNQIIKQVGVASIQKVFPFKNQQKQKVQTDLSKIYYFRFDASRDVHSVASEFSQDQNIVYAEPLKVHRMYGTVPNDPKYPDQYHFNPVQAELAWDITQGSEDVIVGIIDSGVDLFHPDLQDNIWANEVEINGTDGADDDGNGYVDDYHGWDFVGASSSNIVPDNDPNQTGGSAHGTHVAGITGAVGNNGTGVAGMSWDVQLMVTKHSPDTESRSIYFGYEGIVYCVDNGADIVNLSWGGSFSSEYARDIINYAYENDVLVVAAAGNDTQENNYEPPDRVPPHYPSAYEHVLSIANTTNVDVLDSSSLYGETVDLAAPGTILSTIPTSQGSYDTFVGTSMASPLVAGVAALVKTMHPDWTNDQLASQIKFTTDNIDSIGNNMDYVEAGGYGAGRVNAFRAVNEPAGIDMKINRLITNDSNGGDGDGQLESGETIEITLDLSNTWGAANDVLVTFETDDYAIEIMDNSASFGDIPGGAKSVTSSDKIVFKISEESLPHNVDYMLRIQSSNADEIVLNQTLAIEPMVLVVGDYTDNDVSGYYLDALDSLGIVYDYKHKKFDPIMEDELNQYPLVIWSCEWAFPSLDSLDRDYISDYLDSGGRLFLSGQDIGWDLADRTSGNNEYSRSDGLSEIFYNSYLKTEYLADASPYATLSGVTDDAIGDGLTFEIFQPGRSSKNQYPDEVRPFGGSVSIFNYPDGTSGAVRYDGAYRLVHFSFGGYEAITDDATRLKVMRRVINWLNGLEIEHMPLNDTENTSDNYEITAQVNSNVDALESVDLYWDIDGTFPYNRITMDELSEGNYHAEIPVQNEEEVRYFIFARTTNGTYTPININRFYVGEDQIQPDISVLSRPFETTISADGPFHFFVSAEDNLGIDTTACYLHWFNEAQQDSLAMQYTNHDRFEGELQLPTELALNEQIQYYFTVDDRSSNRNRVYSDTFALQLDTTEVLDDFERNTIKWQTDAWGRDDKFSKSGDYSISDSPGDDYTNNAENVLMYQYPLDLSPYKNAWFDFWLRHNLVANEDSCFIELSSDSGQTWQSVAGYSGKLFYYKRHEAAFPEFTGEGNEQVWLRVRVSTDSANVKDGVYIDDLQIHTSFMAPTALDRQPIASVPETYYLKQNYPNPFNPATTIEFGLVKRAEVTLNIYSILGQKVKALVDDELRAGKYRMQWNGANEFGNQVASGFYVYRLTVKNKDGGPDKTFIRKMLLIR